MPRDRILDESNHRSTASYLPRINYDVHNAGPCLNPSTYAEYNPKCNHNVNTPNSKETCTPNYRATAAETDYSPRKSSKKTEWKSHHNVYDATPIPRDTDNVPCPGSMISRGHQPENIRVRRLDHDEPFNPSSPRTHGEPGQTVYSGRVSNAIQQDLFQSGNEQENFEREEPFIVDLGEAGEVYLLYISYIEAQEANEAVSSSSHDMPFERSATPRSLSALSHLVYNAAASPSLASSHLKPYNMNNTGDADEAHKSVFTSVSRKAFRSPDPSADTQTHAQPHFSRGRYPGYITAITPPYPSSSSPPTSPPLSHPDATEQLQPEHERVHEYEHTHEPVVRSTFPPPTRSPAPGTRMARYYNISAIRRTRSTPLGLRTSSAPLRFWGRGGRGET